MSKAKSKRRRVRKTPKRLMIFIDGQNMFYGCKGFRKNFKYDVEKLVDVLTDIEPDRELIEVCYYGSLKPVDSKIKGDNGRFRESNKDSMRC